MRVILLFHQIQNDFQVSYLENIIIYLMKEGWRPIGGVSAVLYVNNPDEYKKEDYDTVMYLQAVVK
jgi:hypothetical protein